MSTSGTLLEDETAVQTLNSSQSTANEVNEKQIVAAETEIQIDKACKQYEPIAFYATNLYFLVGELRFIINILIYVTFKL